MADTEHTQANASIKTESHPPPLDRLGDDANTHNQMQQPVMDPGPIVQVKKEDTTVSATWKVKGFPEYFKTGHVKNVLSALGLDVIDVHKKSPNITAYVRFKSVAEKLRAQPIIDAHTEKKIKRLRCIEHPNRKQYENDLAKIKRKQMKRKQNPQESTAQTSKQRKPQIQPTSIHEVVTPFYQKPYEDQLHLKRQKICKDMGRFRRKLTNKKFMNQSFLTWVPPGRSGKVLQSLCPVLGIMSSPATTGYRNKVSFTIGYNKRSNQLTIGFQMGRFEHGAASIESCQECIHIDVISKRVATCCETFVREQYDKHKYDCFHKKHHHGVWRKLNVRTSSRSRQFIVTLEIQNSELDQNAYDTLKNEFKQCLCDEGQKLKDELNYDLQGVTVLINNTVSQVNYNQCTTEILYGHDYHYEYLCGLKFRVSVGSFFQINTESAERLYETAAQWAVNVEGKKNTVLFDICAGTGTIGLCVAKQCGDNIKKLIGLELIEDAVKDAVFNAQLNNFKCDVQFIAGKAEETLQKALDEEVSEEDYVVAIIDPPRCGVHKDICKLLRMKSRIQRIVYVSCNSASCIVDALKLCQTPSKKMIGTPFKPIKAIGVDLFPQTDHVEMIMLLERCTENDVDWSTLSLQASESHRKYLYAESQKSKIKTEI
eukprot:27018_1